MRGKFNKRIVWIRTEKRTRTHSVCVLEGSACERGRKKSATMRCGRTTTAAAAAVCAPSSSVSALTRRYDVEEEGQHHQEQVRMVRTTRRKDVDDEQPQASSTTEEERYSGVAAMLDGEYDEDGMHHRELQRPGDDHRATTAETSWSTIQRQRRTVNRSHASGGIVSSLALLVVLVMAVLALAAPAHFARAERVSGIATAHVDVGAEDVPDAVIYSVVHDEEEDSPDMELEEPMEATWEAEAHEIDESYEFHLDDEEEDEDEEELRQVQEEPMLISSYSGPDDSYLRNTRSKTGKFKQQMQQNREEWNFRPLLGNFVTWEEMVMVSNYAPSKGTVLPKYGDLLARTEYDVCWTGDDIDFLYGGRFSLSDIQGKVGVIEVTSARRRDITSGPLECHLCYVQTGAFQQTASILRDRVDELVFVSVLQHSGDWGRQFTEDCYMWVREDPDRLPAGEAQSSYIVVNENDLNNVLSTLFHSVSTIPHYIVMDCRPCEGGPRENELRGKEGCFLRAIIPDVWNPSIFFTMIRDVRTDTEMTVERWLTELPPSGCG